MAANTFHGWSDAALDFYRQLEANNTKAFWSEHKAVYDAEVRAPFDAFAELVAEEFGPLHFFRPNRDVRFSKDKSPYKTAQGAVTESERGESYYLQISANGLVAGSGYYHLAADQLERFRAAVDDDREGPTLDDIVTRLRAQRLDVYGESLKTAPRGWPRDHPRIHLLRYKGLVAMRQFPPAAWLATKGAAKRVTDAWRAAEPLNAWLGEHVGPSTEPPQDAWG